jgi:hypothetical protein
MLPGRRLPLWMLLVLVFPAPSWPGSGSALRIGDIDLSAFDFDVVAYDVGSNAAGLGGDATASGTSNGVGWSISPTNLWSGRTTTGGTFVFSSLPAPTDNLHPAIDFTLSFDQPVASLLVALSNDSGSDSINFGLVPTDLSGDLESFGSQISLTRRAGGLALFENIDSLTVTHTDNNGVSDGFDLAFYIVSTVPSPGDRDGDGIQDPLDNCPDFPNPSQSDIDDNDIGDPCECGDQNGDGTVDVNDILAINAAIFDPSQVTALCDTNDDQICDVQDILGANAKIFGAEAYCSRYPSPAP